MKNVKSTLYFASLPKYLPDSYIKRLITSHDSDLVKVQNDLSARDSEAAQPKAQAETQRRRLDEQESLRPATEEIKAKTAADERSKTELDRLNSCLREKDNTIADFNKGLS